MSKIADAILAIFPNYPLGRSGRGVGEEFRRTLAFGNFKTATFFENQAVATGSILNSFWKMSNENKTTGSEITAF